LWLHVAEVGLLLLVVVAGAGVGLLVVGAGVAGAGVGLLVVGAGVAGVDLDPQYSQVA